MEYEIYSERKRRMQNEIPDTYQYEIIPQKLRVQILYIWEKVWEKAYYNDFGVLVLSQLATDAYESIEATLRDEYGVEALGESNDSDSEGEDLYQIISNFLLKTENTDNVIDVIEVSFRYIDQVIRDKFRVSTADLFDMAFRTNHRDISTDSISPDEAIDRLNRRFRQHSVGYQYESGQIVKVDSQYIHSEVVKPALMFLSDPIYEGANEEFLNAHEHYRNGRNKECLNDCLKAFESCLKTICKKRKWHYDSEKDTANKLIENVLNNGLIPAFMESHFSGLRSALKSGLLPLRNRKAGHGQESEHVVVSEYEAAYALHLTASNILLLAKADENMK